MVEILLESEKWDFFKEAILVTFSQWTALQLATEFDDLKWKELAELTFLYFQEDKVELEHLEYNFYEWFGDECECEIEDGSMLQVSKDLLDIYQEIMAGELTALMVLRQNSVKLAAELEQQKQQELQQEQGVTPVEKIIDADGFELVQRRKR